MDKNGGNYTFFSFTSADSSGQPEAGLLEASDGLLYGTLYHGGTSALGSVFAVSTDLFSYYAVLYKFTNTNGDGKWPNTELVEGTDGALYGLTQQGGNPSHPGGTISRLTRMGADTPCCEILTRLSAETTRKGAFERLQWCVLWDHCLRGAGRRLCFCPQFFAAAVAGVVPVNDQWVECGAIHGDCVDSV